MSNCPIMLLCYKTFYISFFIQFIKKLFCKQLKFTLIFTNYKYNSGVFVLQFMQTFDGTTILKLSNISKTSLFVIFLSASLILTTYFIIQILY
jgi:hypothetical protein